MGHAPVLVPDYTLFIQLVIFLATYLVLKKFVFTPYLELLHRRQAKTVGLKEEALQARDRAERLKDQYESFMREERKKTAAWLDQERRKVSDEERQMIQAARQSVSEELQIVRSNLKADMDKARLSLMPLVSEYSSQIASKLLGRKVNISGSALELDRTDGSERTVPR